MPDGPPDLVHVCADALKALVPRFTGMMIAEVRRLDTPHRLTPPQARVLKLLSRVSVATLTEVADHLGVRKPTASVLVLKMVQQGLVARKSASTTRLALTLTPAGRAAIDRLDTALTARIIQTIGALSPAEIAVVTEAVVALNRVFALQEAQLRPTAAKDDSDGGEFG